MAPPVQMSNPVRLDDLISAVRRVDEDVLTQLTNAVLLADGIGEVADALIGHFVDQARRSGASWSDIGRSMGVTRQAAQKRFVGKASTRPSAPEGFGRFTESARNVVVTAQNEARAAGHTEISPAHLGLGLLAEPEGLAGRVLAAGRPLDAVRTAVTAALPPGGGTPGDFIPFDDAARAVLEGAFGEAERLGDEVVDTEHVLLALVADAGRVPAGLGVTRPGVESAVAAARSAGSAD
ncbi:ATP-dependent Clp protease ATP-binding subunit [Geodermatophilus sabuli]|uniref:ATP-dependent Clp protease ATP-binding subunit n=1 Tax=Geodermatophilus sabuli TaxID=1564158 RepID=A0A7K3VUG4_9ACTN|nr:Clp protease N-terminal domain-containing protein [Geodermatophilus sabuli]NEK56291.1 ATP-dependent Clp protease ATP-binding subunit [Geodermatophilus sabuli]